MRRLLALVILSSLAVAPGRAQSAGQPGVSAVNLSLGVAPSLKVRTPDGPLFAIEIAFTQSVGRGPLVVEAGVSAAAESEFRLGLGDELTEIHIAVGAQRSVGRALLSAVVGPSFALAGQSPQDDPAGGGRTRVLPGAVASARAVFVVVPRVGVGVEAFAHANTVLPVAGARLVFAFGRLPGAAFPNPPPTQRRPGP